MSARRHRHSLATLILIPLAASCASAGDRLNDGIKLQSQGRYMEAAYRYAEAVEKDSELVEARERLLAAGDTAIAVSMDDADDLERRGDPVASARLYRDIDRLMARVRQVGMRLEPPGDYGQIRRAVFDNAIGWQMTRGGEASDEGRWADAQSYFAGARTDFLEPSRIQVEESYDSEVNVLISWAETELADGHPRAAHARAQQALEVRSSPAREVVLRVRDNQDHALKSGTLVVAILPVTAEQDVREYLGGQFEVDLDDDLQVDHWNQPPLFVQVADPMILRKELRGLLRGQVQQSPTLVGRALGLMGADLGVMIRLARIEVTESDVRRDRHQAVVPHGNPSDRGVERRSDQAMDTVTYSTVRGQMSYYLEAEVVIVDPDGREVQRFTSSSRQNGPFRRGEFDGNPSVLPLKDNEKPYFDPAVIGDQKAKIEGALLEDLAVAIAAGTFDTVLSGVS